MNMGLISLAVLVGLAVFVYIIRLWFNYKKVAVKTKGYPITTGITFLFLAFMALTGILSLSDKLLNSLLTKIGIINLDISQSSEYRWMLITVFIILSLSVILILRKSTQSFKKHNINQSVGGINSEEGNITSIQNTYTIDGSNKNESGTTTINNYYGVNPESVQTLKDKLSLKDELIQQLLKTVEEKEDVISKRTQVFEDEVNKYQNLIESISNTKLDQQAKKQLELANWDEAERLLEQANLQDQANISHRNKELAQINELKFNYSKAIEYYQQVLNVNPTDLNTWEDIARLFERFGDSKQALHSWQQLQNYAKDRHDKRWLMVAFIGEADILAKHGYGSRALDIYTQAHFYFDLKVVNDPNNSDWQRDLSVSFNKIGDMHKANGDGDKAIGAYQDSLKIAESLAKRDPNNSDWQRDLVVSYVKISENIPENYSVYIQKALFVVEELYTNNRLYPCDHWMIEDLKKRLQ